MTAARLWRPWAVPLTTRRIRLYETWPKERLDACLARRSVKGGRVGSSSGGPSARADLSSWATAPLARSDAGRLFRSAEPIRASIAVTFSERDGSTFRGSL
jgi:hypothetical protein